MRAVFHTVDKTALAHLFLHTKGGNICNLNMTFFVKYVILMVLGLW